MHTMQFVVKCPMVTMTSITIRKLDDEVKKRLRVRAALNDRSMEEEARLILRDALMSTSTSQNLADAIRSHFGPENGLDLELPPRGSVREPPTLE